MMTGNSFIPKTESSAIDPMKGTVVAPGRLEPGSKSDKYSEQEFGVTSNGIRYKFFLAGYGANRLDLYYVFNTKSKYAVKRLEQIRQNISGSGMPLSLYQALFYVAQGIVTANNGRKNTRVSVCLNAAEWPELLPDIPSDARKGPRGETIIYQATFS